jgi:sodium-dependent dicarboxylate transporter 2/3/5
VADHRGDAGTAAGRIPVSLALGPAVFLALLVLPVPDGMAPEAWRVAAVATWMAVWWSTEAVPVPVTALLPIVLFPLLGVVGVAKAAAPFAHPLIFLFLGGFLIAAGIQKWGLHRRIALGLVLRLGTRPTRLVAGFMLATAILSMWVSNTATAMLMLPIALAVIAQFGDGEGRVAFTKALLLGVAYAASIGGLGTLIGTPPNALLAAFAAETYGIQIGFARWMAVGLPLVLVLGPLTWLLLTRVVYRLPDGPRAPLHDGAAEPVARLLRELGPISGPERRVALVFAATAALWLLRPLIEDLPLLSGISDTGIALAAGILLFVLPSGQGGRLMDWKQTATLPWGTLILFGGGLSLADAADASGLAAWIGAAMGGLADWPPVLLVAAVVTVVVFLTELTSNTATAAAFLPLMGALALTAGMPPLELMAPVAVAASAAFMLPVATPPNAIVYGSGEIAIADMIRAGLWVNALSILTVSLLLPPLLGLVFGG